MNKCSVTIICFNEEALIADCIQSALSISNDVIVVDSFSTDDTPTICKQFPVHFDQHPWTGYGNQKNYAASLAKNDWILSLDADEQISSALRESILKVALEQNTLYKIKRRNQYAGKWMRFGMYGRDSVLRFYHKKMAQWNSDVVHENLEGINNNLETQQINGTINHVAYANIEEHKIKAAHYAKLGADKLFLNGKKSNTILTYLKASFRFVKEYFFLLGFLDGKEGYSIARINAKETFMKYKLLNTKTKVK